MNRIGKLVVSRPKIVIAATLAITIWLAAVMATRGVVFNGSPETLTRHDKELQFFNEIRSTFGDDRVIVVGLTTDDVFTPDFIADLGRLTTRLAAVKGVTDTLSLTNIKSVRRDDRGVVVEKLIPRGATPEQLRQIRQEITADPLYVKHYISADGRTAAVNIFLAPLDEAESRATAGRVEEVVREVAGQYDNMVCGVPILDARGVRSMVRDMLVLSPIALILSFLVFLVAFRSFWGAALPMAALVIGLIWTIGLMRLLGYPITFATLSLPTTLMAVGSSYLFHMLNQYRISMVRLGQETDSAARRESWLEGLKFIGPAVLVSGTTTMAGFGALGSSPVPTVRDMGMFESLGVFFMLVLSLAFIPAVLTLLPRDALMRGHSGEKDYATWLNPILRNITAWIMFRGRGVLIAAFVITCVTGAGAYWLRVNTDYLKIFPDSSETVQAADKLHERLAGAAPVQIVVTGSEGAATDPAFLERVEALEEFASNQEGVDAVLSVTDIIKRLNSRLDSSPESREQLPKDPARLKAIYDDYLSQDESLSRLVSPDRARALVVLNTNLFDSNKLRALTDKLLVWSRANLGSSITARVTGSIVLLNDASDAVAASQSWSLGIALVSIYLMMAFLFRSFATGLLALIPNLLPIVCFFGFLGWSGYTLDITTSLVASSVLGLAVDNAVHMIRRYRQAVFESAHSEDTEGWAMWLTVLRTGKPMVLANLMLVAAFLIFMLSSFIPVRIAGMLWAVTIIACLAADLIFLPVLMRSRLFSHVTLGDSQPPEDRMSEKEFTGVEKVVD